MEFESTSDQGQQASISDDQRLAATTKRVVLQPLHLNIAPEPVQADGIASGTSLYDYDAGDSLENEDTANTSSLISPSSSD